MVLPAWNDDTRGVREVGGGASPTRITVGSGPDDASGGRLDNRMTSTMPPLRKTMGSDFAILSRRITDAGLMQRRPAYYLTRLSIVTLMFLGGWTAFFVIGSSW